MADDLLSAAELETLLSPAGAVVSGAASPRAPKAPATILPYGRNASGKLEPGLQQALMAVHGRCASEFAAALTTLARRPAEVRANAVRVESYRELDRRLESPTCLQLLSGTGVGAWLLEITLAVLYPAIDCMLGGGRVPGTVKRKPPTEIELRLAARLTGLFLGALTSAWSDIAPLELSVDRVECNPRSLPIVASDALAVCVRFEVDLAGTRGTIHLAMPAEVLRVFASRAAQSSSAGVPSGGESPRAADPSDATVEIVAHLAETTIEPHELEALSPGDLMTTSTPADATVAVFQNGELRFHARSGAVAGRKAIEIERLATASGSSASKEDAETSDGPSSLL